MMRKLYKSFRLNQKQERSGDQKRAASSFREQIKNEGNQSSTQNNANKPNDGLSPNNNVVKPPEWEKDEELVRGSHCQFRVKYLGSKEVNDSRGMQLCDDAFSALMARYKQMKKNGNGISSVMHMKLLKSKSAGTTLTSGGSQKPAQNAYFYISSDGLRVVDENSKSLIVDQTIEKVSFCAPVRLNPRGFAYIARDGASKRWMCHVLLAKDVQGEGERLSHAVGCAFSACLEAKKQRDALCSVEANFHNKNKSVFEKQGTFREQKPNVETKDETKKEPLSKRVYGVVKNAIPEDEEWTDGGESADAAASLANVQTPDSAIERKRAPAAMLERMQSMKEFSKLNSKHDLPFSDRSKRQNMSMQLKHSVSATEGLGTSAISEVPRQRPTLPKQQSLCIEDSRAFSQDGPNSSRHQQVYKLETSHAMNSFDDSFTTTPVANNSNHIPSSTSVPTFQPGFNQRTGYGFNVAASVTTAVTSGAEVNLVASPSVEKPAQQSELSSTNPFFIYVADNSSEIPNDQGDHQNSTSSGWTTAEMNNQLAYAPTNPFSSSTQQSSVYSL